MTFDPPHIQIWMDVFAINVDPHVFPADVCDDIPGEFVRSASMSIPRTEQAQVVQRVPTFIAFRPIPPNVKVPLINCKRGDYPKCGFCKAFLSPFVEVNAKAKSWRCAICKHLNSTLHFTSMYDMRVNVTDREELHNLVYDCLPPRNFEAIRGKARIFMFVVDEGLLERDSASYQTMINQIEDIGKVCRETDQVALITYGSCVTLVNLETLRGRAFPEFDPNLISKKDQHFVNAEKGIPAIAKALKALWNTKTQSGVVYHALQWAITLMDKLGGRLLLFTTGRVTDEEKDLAPAMHTRSISLNVFKLSPIERVEQWAQTSGGMIRPFGQISSVSSLFSTETAWDACSVLRVPSTVQITGVMGNVSRSVNDVEIHPVITSTESIIYELKTGEGCSGDCCFQLSFRYLDELGVRKVRVINGRLPFVDVVKYPIDEAALALYITRKRALEHQERLFHSRIVMTRSLQNENSILPQLLYGGSQKDNNFIVSTSVERFALSIVPTTVTLGCREFKVIWSPNITLVYPKPEENEIEALRTATTHLGLYMNNFFTPETEDEFNSMVGSYAHAQQWYSQVQGFAPPQ